MNLRISIFHPLLTCILLFKCCKGKDFSLTFGILKTVDSETQRSEKYCYIYYPPVSEIPSDESELIYTPVNSKLWNVCEDPPTSDDINGTFAFAKGETNCTLMEEGMKIEDLGGLGTIFVGNNWPTQVNKTNSTLNFGFVTNSTYHKIMEQNENDTLKMGLYSSVKEGEFIFKYNLILIWLMAQFSIVVGAYWSGMQRHKLYLEEQGGVLGEPRAIVEGGPTYIVKKEESALTLTPKVVLMLVLLMSVVLVSLWFLLAYLVYIIIVIFCLASFFAVYGCLEPLVMLIPCGKCRTPYFNLYLVHGVLEVRQILLVFFAAALPIIWFVFRKDPHSWILQDILGVAFTINFIRLVRLPNLMICTLLLTLLVLYDIFFVFITPFITSSGTSIMVDVAQGGSSDEELPMVLKVPYFLYPEFYDVCGVRDYSLLGFGDILVPGLLIAFVHSFDLKVGTPCRLYFLVTSIAYGVGLLCTFLALYLMRGAQPALFYLVPATIIPTVIIAAAREELSHMWTNKTPSEKNNSEAIDDYPRIIREDPNLTPTIDHSGSLPSSHGSHKAPGSTPAEDPEEPRKHFDSFEPKIMTNSSSTEALNKNESGSD